MNLNVLKIVENSNDLNLLNSIVSKLEENNISISILLNNNELKKDDYPQLKFINRNDLYSLKFDIVEISIYSSLYPIILRYTKRKKIASLVNCYDFSANFSFPVPLKTSSTFLSYAYYQTRLTFANFLLTSSLVAKRRIEDTGVEKTVYINNPCFKYLYLSGLNSEINFKITSEKKKVILMDTSLFKGEEIVEFISGLKKLDDIFYPCLIIDSSTTDFSSLYSIDNKYIFSSKDFNRLSLYKNASYIYSHQNKIDDFDLELASKLNIPIISSLDELSNLKNEDLNHILSESKEYVLNKFTEENYVKRLISIYESIRRKRY